jgi:geranyl-CoA carboxylase beta subunit
MGGEQAATTMDQVMRFAAQRRGEAVDESALQAQRERLVKHFTDQESAVYTSGRLLDQGIIDPRDSRRVLGFGLQTCLEARHRQVQPNSFGVARM